SFSRCPAEEFMDRNAETLSRQVPQRNVDRAQRPHDDGTAEMICAIHELPVVPDPPRILSDEVIAERLHRFGGGLLVGPGTGLTETVQSVIGFNADVKNPVDLDRANSSDLWHQVSYWIGCCVVTSRVESADRCSLAFT